jgi:GAF domain-containing protein
VRATARSSTRVESAATAGRTPRALDHARLQKSLRTLSSGELVHSTTRKKLLRVVALAAKTFEGCAAAATVDDHPGEVCTSSAAYHLDRAQYRSGAGPGTQAAKSLRAVRVDAIDRCTWIEYRRTAAENRIASSLSIPLICDDVAIGVLNLYSCQAGAFVGCEHDAAAFAAAAAVLLASKA